MHCRKQFPLDQRHHDYFGILTRDMCHELANSHSNHREKKIQGNIFSSPNYNLSLVILAYVMRETFLKVD